MKQEVINELASNDLLERLEEEEKQLTLMKLSHTVSPLENPNKLKVFRKNVARLKTEIRRRQIDGKL